MAGVLVFGEAAGGELTAASRGALSAGAGLAEAWGQPLLAVLMGAGLGAPAVAAFRRGPERLYVVEDAHFEPYAAGPYVDSALAVVQAAAPSAIVAPHTARTRDWMAQLAARLDTSLVTDCIALALEAGELVATKPVFGGSVEADFVLRGAPAVATIRAEAFVVREAAVQGEIVTLRVAVPSAAGVAVLEEIPGQTGGGVKLKDARIIVAGGRGLGGPENWHYIEDAAAALGAATGCSRPVADAGWVPFAHQVGLSGASVAPELYVAVGISGAVHHLAGISAARTVVAINRDPDADIFKRASLGVVGDYREVLPAFTARVRQLRSG